ncbi:MAG: hypothetical protein AAGI52_04900 [Bacteroidota bacterium]
MPRLFLVLLLAASTQGLLFAQAAWLVNQEWIANTLCVNRDKPELNCDGKCLLAERMHQMQGHTHGDHTHEHHDPAALLELALSVRAHVTERLGTPEPPTQAERDPAAGLFMDTGREASQGVFHPPRAIDRA